MVKLFILKFKSCKNQGINHLGSVPPSLYCLWDVNIFGTLSDKHVLSDDSKVESFYWFGVKINRLISKLIQRNEMITHSFVRGYRIMVITLAFQANDVSSILTIRSRILVLTSLGLLQYLTVLGNATKLRLNLISMLKVGLEAAIL